MKPTTLFSSLLSAIGVSAIATLPSFAQTTSVPIVGGSFTATTTFATSSTIISGASALTSFGPIIFSSVTGGTVAIPEIGFNSAIPFSTGSRLPVVNDTVIVSNSISNGTISSQSFTGAPLSVTSKIQSLSDTATTATVIANISTGTIGLPTSLVTSSTIQTTSVPVIGGSLSVTNNFLTGIQSLNSGGNLLTSFGPISISSWTINNANNQAGAVIQNGVLTVSSSREDRLGDSFSANGNISGTLSGNTLNNVGYAVTGTLSGLVFTPNVGVPSSSLVTLDLNGGTVSLPTSLVNSFSGGTSGFSLPSGTGGFNSPISLLIAVNQESAIRIFNVQPVRLTEWFGVATDGVSPRNITSPRQATNRMVSGVATDGVSPRNITVVLPTFSALANSRIHPDLFGR